MNSKITNAIQEAVTAATEVVATANEGLKNAKASYKSVRCEATHLDLDEARTALARASHGLYMLKKAQEACN